MYIQYLTHTLTHPLYVCYQVQLCIYRIYLLLDRLPTNVAACPLSGLLRDTLWPKACMEKLHHKVGPTWLLAVGTKRCCPVTSCQCCCWTMSAASVHVHRPRERATLPHRDKPGRRVTIKPGAFFPVRELTTLTVKTETLLSHFLCISIFCTLRYPSQLRVR